MAGSLMSREPIILEKDVTPQDVFDLAARSIDLAYQHKGENAYVSLPVNQVDWILQQAALGRGVLIRLIAQIDDIWGDEDADVPALRKLAEEARTTIIRTEWP